MSEMLAQTRHSGAMNVGFLDGHVGRKKLNEIPYSPANDYYNREAFWGYKYTMEYWR
jgi:prepilin-type processing-associated H-X9-DG protein